MYGIRFSDFRRSLAFTERGAFFWKLWAPIFLGFAVVTLYWSYFESGEIPDDAVLGPFLSNVMYAAVLRDGAVLLPIMAISGWWSTSETRTRMLANGSLQAYLLLPFSPVAKITFLLVRTSILPFLGMSLGAVVTLTVSNSARFFDLLQLLPVSVGMSIFLGALGWSGTWSIDRDPMTNTARSSQIGSGNTFFTVLVILTLPVLSLLHGVWLFFVSLLPFVFAMFWLVHPDQALQISVIGSASTTGHGVRNRYGDSPGIPHWLAKRRSVRCLRLYWRASAQYSVKTLMGTAIWIMIVVYVLYFTSAHPRSENIGVLVMLLMGIFSVIATTQEPASVDRCISTLPLQAFERAAFRWTVQILVPTVIAVLMIPVATGIILILIQLVPFFGPQEAQQSIGWMELTSGSVALSARVFIPAGILVTSCFLGVMTALRLYTNTFQLVRLWNVAHGWLCAIFGIGFLIFVTDVSHSGNVLFLQNAHNARLLLLSFLSLMVLLGLQTMSEKRVQGFDT